MESECKLYTEQESFISDNKNLKHYFGVENKTTWPIIKIYDKI